MKIGIVTTWFERGAAYVSKTYMQLLEKEGYEVFIYARGGEKQAKGDPHWDFPNVTWNGKVNSFSISFNSLCKWINNNKITNILFNEQNDFKILAMLKSKMPGLVIGAYIDYYTEETLPFFNIYDYVICNTHRHMQALDNHRQQFYFKWGTDVNLYKPVNDKQAQITFFHSVGMSTRKGTDVLLDSYINDGLYKNSKLIIHTQIPISKVCNYSLEELQKFNIDIIQRTVSAPGLYYLADVYVYPTRLDGLGLTMYEALSSGLPVITTNYPPMNEAVDDSVGKLVNVKRNYARKDAYYWPMSICDSDDLTLKMQYYIDNPDVLEKQKINARRKAEREFDIFSRSNELKLIMDSIKLIPETVNYIDLINKYYFNKRILTRVIRKLGLMKE